MSLFFLRLFILSGSSTKKKKRSPWRIFTKKQEITLHIIELLTFLSSPPLLQRSQPVNHLLKNFLPTYNFSPIITRSFHPPKPDPAGILHIAAEWGLEDGGAGLIMVCLLFLFVFFFYFYCPPPPMSSSHQG